MNRGLRGSLERFLQAGERQVGRWVTRHRCVEVLFSDGAAFVNANTQEELQRIQDC